MPRPIQATIHIDALAHNLEQARTRVGPSRIWGVVKANAYGHTIAHAYSGLRGVDGFAVLTVNEAEQLRALDWKGPILLTEGCFEPGDLDDCSRYALWHVVHCDEQITWLSRCKAQEPQHIYLKMNSGMNRLGFKPQAFRTAWARLMALPQVGDVSLMTHFSDADGERGIAHQVAVFEATVRDLPGKRSLSNSAAILRHNVKSDWVRAGILCYGSAPDFPSHDYCRWHLRPAMTLCSRVIAEQHLAHGDTVGYGSSFVATETVRIGIVACGYGDGYPRHASTGTPVLVDGIRTRTVGRVSMDMLAVDLTMIPAAGVGSEVTLWGCGPNGSSLGIDEVAHAAGTISYELMCGVSPRVPMLAIGHDGQAASAMKG